MDAFHTPLVDCFKRGDAPRDVRLLAAMGGLVPRAQEQLALLALLVNDPYPEVRAAADATISRLPPGPLAAFLADPDVPDDVREFFSARAAGPPPGMAADALPADESLAGDAGEETPAADDIDSVAPSEGGTPAVDGDAAAGRRGAAHRLSMMTVADRMKVAMQGSREERSILVRDPNRLVSAAVLSSPRLTESEVETIARMTNVSDEVLRALGSSRVWTKNYSVVAALTRNAKTPIPVALTLLNRLTERDVKMLGSDRNIPEPVRLSARKIYSRGAARRR